MVHQKGDRMKFILESSDETLTTHSGLALIGLLLSKTNLNNRLNEIKIPEIKSTPSVPNSDAAKAYIGLLSQSKNDFDRIEEFRDDDFFKLALQLRECTFKPNTSSAIRSHTWSKAFSTCSWSWKRPTVLCPSRY